MADYPIVKLGDLCRIEKGQTGIQSATPGNYPLVTTGPERKSADSYQFDTAAVCIPLVSSSGHGKKSLNYVHYQEGKFALGTILAAVIPHDPNQLNAAFLQQYLQFFKDTKLVSLMKGAANVSLSMRDIAQVEVPLPPIEQQNRFIEVFNRATNFSEQLFQEFDKQLSYVAQLRQTILQEAIEGKLTAQWRAQHPTQAGNPDYDAVAVLAQIKAEKQRLIAEKKIGKENPLPPIREEEMPFDLPEGWVWCRLGEVVKSMTNGLYKPAGYYSDNGIISLRMFNIQEGSIILEGAKRLRVTPDEMNTYLLEQGDILINRVNSKELVGKAALIRETQEDMVFESMNIRVRFLVSTHLPDYVNLLFRSLYIQNICYGLAKQAIGQASINQSQLAKIEIPLPPLAEQRAIVERVDRLLAMVDELAAQVAVRKSQADALMQAVLREAFQPTPP